MSQKTMMMFSADWRGERTFRLMPVSKDCPFNEALYDPVNKMLAIIGVNYIPKLQMIPKLDGRGEVSRFETIDPEDETKKKKVLKLKQERVAVDTYYEYYIDQANDIREFITTHAINPTHTSINILNTKVEEKKPKTKKDKVKDLKPKKQ